MNLQQSVKKLLSDLKQKNQQLLVKWNAGGDETIVNIFTLEGGTEKYLNDGVYELNSHIADLLDLPNAGDNYNHGKGEIYFGGDENIFIKYDEMAYNDDEDVIEEQLPGNIQVSNIKDCKNYMKKKSIAKIDFWGTISFLMNQDPYLSIQVRYQEMDLIKEFRSDLHDLINKTILSFYKGKSSLLEIGYNGYLTSEHIIIDKISLYKYKLRKNNKGKIRPLF